MPDLSTFIDLIEEIPILGAGVRLLKKIGFLKDYERLYKTDQKVKALGSAFNKVKIPIERIIHERQLQIPAVIIFRQKGLPSPEQLTESGFVNIEKSMGFYVLPPLATTEAKIKDGLSLQAWMEQQFSLSSKPMTNIRFALFTELSDVLSYKHPDIDSPTLFETLMPHIIQYLGADKSMHMAREYFRKEKREVSERELINKSPLLHMFADFIDNESYKSLVKKEDEMLKELITLEAITDTSYESLSKIKKSRLKRVIEKHLGEIQDIDEAIKSAIGQAKFMAEKL